MIGHTIIRVAALVVALGFTLAGCANGHLGACGRSGSLNPLGTQGGAPPSQQPCGN